MQSSEYVSIREYIEALFREYQAAHRREHELMEKDADRARTNIDGRLTELNRLRAEVMEDRGEYLTRAEFSALRDAINQRSEAMEKSKAAMADVASLRIEVASLRESRANLEGRMTTLIGGVGFGLLVVQLALRFWPG